MSQPKPIESSHLSERDERYLAEFDRLADSWISRASADHAKQAENHPLNDRRTIYGLQSKD